MVYWWCLWYLVLMYIVFSNHSTIPLSVHVNSFPRSDMPLRFSLKTCNSTDAASHFRNDLRVRLLASSCNTDKSAKLLLAARDADGWICSRRQSDTLSLCQKAMGWCRKRQRNVKTRSNAKRMEIVWVLIRRKAVKQQTLSYSVLSWCAQSCLAKDAPYFRWHSSAPCNPV